MSASTPPAGETDREPAERGRVLQVILLVAANLVFLLLIYPISALAALDQDISEFNGTEAARGWFLLWPGMLIVWGAAWLGFSVFAAKSHMRRALTTFNVIAALWLVPVTAYVLSLFARA